MQTFRSKAFQSNNSIIKLSLLVVVILSITGASFWAQKQTACVGWWKILPPTDVQASDGMYADKVLVSWQAASRASFYKVYRATSATGTKSLLGSFTVTRFNDTTATPGVSYHYWVVAYRGGIHSDYGASETGWQKLSPPANVQASEGMYSDKVLISWNVSSGASFYQVYRATSETGTKEHLGSSTLTNINDTAATAGVIYYYWVIACMDANCSGYSNSDTGWQGLPTPTYYVSPTGNDSNAGTSPASAWKTLAKVNTFPFKPGDTILFERNGVWTGPGTANSTALDIERSGTAGAPITFGAYGIGSPPVLRNPPLDNGTRVVIVYASWVVIEDFLLKDAHRTGIDNSDRNSHNNIFRNLEIANVGDGIALLGTYNLVTQNYIHDTHMVVNTPGGGGDDWGANGVDILNAHNEISYNRFVNCEAPSHDFGVGGGATEIYQMGDYTSIHHNWSLTSAGFIEVSSNGTGSAKNVTIAYNVIINPTTLTGIHISNQYATQIQNFRVENNTIVDLRTHSPLIWRFIVFMGAPSPDSYIFQNNIVYLKDYSNVATDTFIRQNNLYYLPNPVTTLGFTLGTGEKMADPKFMNLSTYEFHLISTSPAIDSGLPLGYTLDFDGLPVSTTNPEIGAYEFSAP